MSFFFFATEEHSPWCWELESPVSTCFLSVQQSCDVDNFIAVFCRNLSPILNFCPEAKPAENHWSSVMIFILIVSFFFFLPMGSFANSYPLASSHTTDIDHRSNPRPVVLSWFCLRTQISCWTQVVTQHYNKIIIWR